MCVRLLSFALALFLNLPQVAFSKDKSVYLVDQDQKRLKIARLTLTGATYKLNFLEAPFGDYFLSMRPFRCIDTERMVCHQPYPYHLKRTLTDKNLRPLEYDLIFISRKAGEYGIDPYNGRYYVLQRTSKGFIGTIHAVDLNTLASPPEDGVIYPITQYDLDELEPESTQYPKLLIE